MYEVQCTKLWFGFLGLILNLDYLFAGWNQNRNFCSYQYEVQNRQVRLSVGQYQMIHYAHPKPHKNKAFEAYIKIQAEHLCSKFLKTI
jgi:hypothetical protein